MLNLNRVQDFKPEPVVSQFPAISNPTGMGMSTEDVNLNKAIEESLKLNTQTTYEPLDVENRSRNTDDPVGLKNIGNTCYFNSLMQTLFRIRPFVKEILNLENVDKVRIPAEEPAHIQRKLKESSTMIKNLQELFVRLIGSNQKYADPSPVLNKCVNSMGEHVKIGDQQDITEYAINFFERIEEVLSLLNHSMPDVIQNNSG